MAMHSHGLLGVERGIPKTPFHPPRVSRRATTMRAIRLRRRGWVITPSVHDWVARRQECPPRLQTSVLSIRLHPRIPARTPACTQQPLLPPPHLVTTSSRSSIISKFLSFWMSTLWYNYLVLSQVKRAINMGWTEPRTTSLDAHRVRSRICTSSIQFILFTTIIIIQLLRSSRMT